MIHRNKPIVFNTIFGTLNIASPYLWCPGKDPSKPLIDEMKVYHHGRSEAINRSLSDFGIEDSFASAAERFEEHYHYAISSIAVARSTKKVAGQASRQPASAQRDYFGAHTYERIDKPRGVFFHTNWTDKDDNTTSFT